MSPGGAWPWWVAGPLIGAVVPLLLWIGGRQLGISANLRHLCAACLPAGVAFFRYDWRREGLWNLIFLAGILGGGFVGHRLLDDPARPVEVAPSTAVAITKPTNCRYSAYISRTSALSSTIKMVAGRGGWRFTDGRSSEPGPLA